ncbi:MAG: hypothetical protein GF334_07525 [Candidatus Altiarchaeales archaeon]|nr:hypothetical protein [Candidatus Altiarchaeales archaeon]
MYQYLVQCWIDLPPGTEHERREKIKSKLKHYLSHVLHSESEIDKAVEYFSRVEDGRVLEPFIHERSFEMESDDPITDPVKELMPTIWEGHPEAVFVAWQKIPTSK